MGNSSFSLSGLIEDSKKVLTAPRGYFADMPKTGGFAEPIIKALIYGVAAGVIGFIIGMLGLSKGGIVTLVATPIVSLVGLFIGAVIVLVVSLICSGEKDFQAATRMQAAIMVMFPIQTFLSVVGGLSVTLGMLVGLLAGLYGLFLFYNGMVHSLKAKPTGVKIVAGVIAALMAVSTVGSIVAMKAMPALSKKAAAEMGQDRAEVEQMQKQMEAATKKMMQSMDPETRKQLEEAMKKAQSESR